MESFKFNLPAGKKEELDKLMQDVYTEFISDESNVRRIKDLEAQCAKESQKCLFMTRLGDVFLMESGEIEIDILLGFEIFKAVIKEGEEQLIEGREFIVFSTSEYFNPVHHLTTLPKEYSTKVKEAIHAFYLPKEKTKDKE